MLLISRTFEVVTPESAEDGEAEESGFLVEGEAVTFRELVSLMRDHPLASSSPCAAHLIAAAPELLAALELIYSNAGESPEWIRSRIGSVIQKAKGQL